MRIFWAFLFIIFLTYSSLAVVPKLSAAPVYTVSANGLNSLAFIVSQEAVSPEVERSLRYALENLPASNPPVFDETSKIIFWRPETNQVGDYNFALTVKDPLGQKETASFLVKVLPAPGLTPLPRGWDDFKLSDKYLQGQQFLPATNLLNITIAPRPTYSIELVVRDARDQLCYLTYLPKEGADNIFKNQNQSTIMLGGQYSEGVPKLVRRDIYEDLFNTLGRIFKCVDAIKISGNFWLQELSFGDDQKMIAAQGLDNIERPRPILSFDDRVYENNLFSQQEPLKTASTPAIKIEFDTNSGVIWRRSKLTIDDKVYHAARDEFSLIIVKPAKNAATFDVNHIIYMLNLSSGGKLAFGAHHLAFEAVNAYGLTLSQEAFIQAANLPAQVQGVPLVFPNPFNPRTGRELTIQYTLSLPTNIELVIFASDGATVTKKRYSSGDEGGQRGINKVTWDGLSSSGQEIANGIYMGAIIDQDENRILDKFRITIYR
jgi:hypothetical protein